MNGVVLTRLDKIEKELKEIKALVKESVEPTKTSAKKELTLVEIAKRLKVVGKEITPKELEEEIRAVRAGEK